MKKTLGLIIIMVCLSTLYSCSEGEPRFEMKAEVAGLSEKLEVNVTEAEYAEGIYWIIISEETEILNSDGKKISRDEIAMGDKVIITYNGQVMMSYPPQVAAIKIEITK